MVLDMRTIVFITMIFNFIFAVGLLIGVSNGNSFKGLKLIAFGFFLSSFGFLLMFLRDHISSFLSVVVCNTSILFGVIMSCWGLFEFYYKKMYNRIFDYIGLGVFFALFYYFLVADNNVNMRIIIICVYLIYYYVLSFYAVTYKPAFHKPKANWFMGGFLLTIILYYLFRLVFTLGDGALDNFMNAGLVHSVAIVFFAVWSVVICFGVFIVMNAITQEDLEKDVYLDSLTGLYNRRAITDETFKFNVNHNMSGNIYCYILCDVDDFKLINDSHGHIFGDYVLSKISEDLQTLTRQGDFISRYGGDEFFIYMVLPKGQSIDKVSEKIRDIISQKTYTMKESSVSTTLSIGVYTTSNVDVDNDYALSKADEALYLAKEQGKNCIKMIQE